MLRKFDSGVMVIQSKTHSDEEVISLPDVWFRIWFFSSYHLLWQFIVFSVLHDAEVYILARIWLSEDTSDILSWEEKKGFE